MFKGFMLSTAAAAMIGLATSASAATIWDETLDGDLSFNGGSPTELGALGVGEFDIFGTLTTNDRDAFNWTLDGSILESLTLIKWVTGAPGTDFGFFGANSPTTAVEIGSASNFILNPNLIGQDLFDIIGVSKSGSEFSAATITGLTVNQYGFRITTVAAPSTVPLPAGLPLMIAGLGALGIIARRRRH